MKKDFKNDFLRIYALVFIIFLFVSSIKCMYDLISKINFLQTHEGFMTVILFLIIVIHIGSSLLIFSGRLKDKN